MRCLAVYSCTWPAGDLLAGAVSGQERPFGHAVMNGWTGLTQPFARVASNDRTRGQIEDRPEFVKSSAATLGDWSSLRP
jgi:hypothetical protein